jgi:endoglucanase
MLIALGAADEGRFDSIWAWTRQHLQRPDGLLAWRWSDGSVTDDEPAADADLDAARALVQAGISFNRPDLTTAGNSLAATVLARLTAPTSRGIVILPGLWAASDSGYSYNPSYASPAAFKILARSTGDTRWDELQLGARSITISLLQAQPLPPDWARISTTGAVQALPGPTGQGPPIQYGYDASRLPIRYAESCTAEDVVLAAVVAPTLSGITPLVTVLDLDGNAISSDLNAISYTARAAAHAAAGDFAKAREDLNRAEDVNSLYPTYYGSAWLALTRNFLDSTVLGGCPPLAGR